jgi:neurofibromin 1
MVNMPAGTTYEIDPSKAMGQDVALNQQNIEYVASNFLQIISSSLPVLPG